MLEDVQITKIEKFNDLFLRILKQMRSWITLKKKKSECTKWPANIRLKPIKKTTSLHSLFIFMISCTNCIRANGSNTSYSSQYLSGDCYSSQYPSELWMLDRVNTQGIFKKVASFFHILQQGLHLFVPSNSKMRVFQLFNGVFLALNKSASWLQVCSSSA